MSGKRDECHRCLARSPVPSHYRCTCERPQTDFYVETDAAVAAGLDSHGPPATEAQRAVHAAAVHIELDWLAHRGHDAGKIAQARSALAHAPGAEALFAVPAPGLETRKPSDLDLDDPAVLRQFIVQTMDEETRDASSAERSFKREVDLERGAFKILVRSSTPSPVNPARMISSSRSSGSGFLVDPKTLPVLGDNGTVVKRRPAKPSAPSDPASTYIVTNGHVVRNADSIAVVSALYPTVQMRAELVSVCFGLDIAFLRVTETKKWRPDEFIPFTLCADQTRFIQPFDEAGGGECGFSRLEPVFAVGYPLGVPKIQITKGNISGFHQIFQEPVIQITAPINPGSSGGALVNSKGEVLGITSAGIQSGENIGFSIPVQSIFNLKEVVDQADKYGRVLEIPFLGAEFVGTDVYARTFPDWDEDRDTVIVETDDGGGLTRVMKTRAPKPGAQRTGVLIVKFDPISLLLRPSGGAEMTPRTLDVIAEFAGFRIGNDGLTRDDTYPRKMSLRDLYRTLPFEKVFRVKFFRGTQEYTNDYVFSPKLRNVGAGEPAQEYPIRRTIKETGDRPGTFQVPGQLALSELTLNFVDVTRKAFPHLSFYGLKENRTTGRVVVILDQTKGLSAGDIVVRVGGRDVRGIKDAKAAALESPGTHVLVEAASGRQTLLLVDPMLAQSMKMMAGLGSRTRGS